MVGWSKSKKNHNLYKGLANFHFTNIKLKSYLVNVTMGNILIYLDLLDPLVFCNSSRLKS